ncbi:hypothetical protein WAB17_01605 [Parerythrobacter aurantius]|uniref:hypothetical protein n=1 Tax=Parerythrobacter aurantius TaxID=3127706 RepID=UPI0032540AF4
MAKDAAYLNEHYRFWLHTRRPNCSTYDRGDDVPLNVSCARLSREKESHRGIKLRTALHELQAHAVNQDFLEEIGCLNHLEYLELEYPVTASDLSPLAALAELRILKINSPRNIADFTPILALPKLERLFIENAKHLADLDWLRPLAGRLKVLGIEGSMYTAQRIPSLAPLDRFALEALFLTNTKLDDQSLSALRGMNSLRFLGTALNAPRSEFEALHAAQPQVQCDWFRPEMWATFKDPRPPKG